MCGISGFVRFHLAEHAGLLQRLTAPLRHRGPEDEGYALWEPGKEGLRAYCGPETQRGLNPPLRPLPPDAVVRAGMGFRRLAIQDLSACGHQPMLSEDGQVALTFNGEIFNFQALREELSQQGATFMSRSDTEVILQGFLLHGVDWVQKLSGMFAIAILDQRDGTAYLIRDRLGIKPLFVYHAPHGVYWASEAKVLADAGLFTPAPDWTGLAAAFSLQAPVLPRTCFEQILAVEPGTFWKIDVRKGTADVTQYWALPKGESINISARDAAEELEARLRKTTAQYLTSDVPVATLMSGGLDSTLITAFASEHTSIEAFTLSLDGSGSGLDETPQARAVARHLGIKHTVVPFEQRAFLDALPQTLANAEAPYPFLEPVEYTAAALHRAGFKVVLNGLGADELLGGYGFYTGYAGWQRRRLLAPLSALIPPISPTLAKARVVLGLRDAIDFWAHNRVGLKRREVRKLITQPAFPDPTQQLRQRVQPGGTPPETFFRLDLFHNVGAHHSLREDASYMAHSVESRYPFLDHELVEWVASLPAGIRYQHGVTKPLLRRVAKKYLPTEILTMPKKGFNLPFGGVLWDDAFFADLCRDHIARLKTRWLLSPKVLDAWWSRRREPFFFHRVWLAVTFEAWWRRFIER